MPQAALNALLAAYLDQADWLEAKAVEFESGTRRLLAAGGPEEIDLSAAAATEYRHKAGNLRAIIAAYERLHAKGT
jgi:hypothetical protein